MSYTKPHLSNAEVEKYETDGYVLCKRPIFSDDEFARLKTIFEEDLAQYGVDGLDVIHFKDDRLLEFLLSDTILDLVGELPRDRTRRHERIDRCKRHLDRLLFDL